MAKLAIKKAKTDVSVYLFIQDGNATDGSGKTGLAYNTADLVCYYVRPGGSATAISLATQTVTGAHSDGGFVEVDSTNLPGVYRLDLPDAVCATGVDSVVVMVQGASGMAPCILELQLNDYDLADIDTLIDAIVAGATAQEVWEYATRTLTSAGDSGATAEEVWEYAARTLTQTATEIEASVSGSSITQIRGNTWDIDITDLTLDSNKIQFALKRSTWQEDTDAILLIDTDTGLLLVNGEAAADASKASLSYTGTTLTVTVDADITAQLPERGCYYGIQSITAAGVVSEPYGGTFKIAGDIVRATV